MESWRERTRILTIVILGFETREEFYFLDIFLCVPYQAYFTFILRGKDFRNEIQVTQDQLLTHKVQHLTQTLLGGSVVSIAEHDLWDAWASAVHLVVSRVQGQ